jgi:hypothetical protein
LNDPFAVSVPFAAWAALLAELLAVAACFAAAAFADVDEALLLALPLLLAVALWLCDAEFALFEALSLPDSLRLAAALL